MTPVLKMQAEYTKHSSQASGLLLWTLALVPQSYCILSLYIACASTCWDLHRMRLVAKPMYFSCSSGSPFSPSCLLLSAMTRMMTHTRLLTTGLTTTLPRLPVANSPMASIIVPIFLHGMKYIWDYWSCPATDLKPSMKRYGSVVWWLTRCRNVSGHALSSLVSENFRTDVSEQEFSMNATLGIWILSSSLFSCMLNPSSKIIIPIILFPVINCKSFTEILFVVSFSKSYSKIGIAFSIRVSILVF